MQTRKRSSGTPRVGPNRSLYLILPACCVPAAFTARQAPAQLLHQLDGLTFTQNFNTLATSGSSNTLPLGFEFAFSESPGNITYAADDGSNAAADTYSYGATGNSDRAFGELTGAATKSTLGCGFINNTGLRIDTIVVGYTGEMWRVGAVGGTDRLDFQYSRDATGLLNGTYINVDQLDFITPNTTSVGAKDGNLPANRTAIAPFAITFSAPMDHGQEVFLRWFSSDITGNDSGLAIDDFSFGYTLSDLNGDFNNDLKVDAADIDLLLLRAPGTVTGATAKFDMNHNGNINLFPGSGGSDADVWVRLNRRTDYGDANLDRTVNTLDFNALASHFNQSNQGWATGDFNGDGKVNALDFNLLAKGFGFDAVANAPPLGSVVPEPTSVLTCAIVLALAPRRRGSMFVRLR